MLKVFKIIKPIEYIEHLKSVGAEFNRYYKFAQVQARIGKVGEEIKTIMKSGLEETVNTVKLDPKTQKPGWVIKNPNGELYIITDTIFRNNYEVLEQNPKNFEIYFSKRNEVTAVQIQENVTFIAPWGSEMNILAGGYLIVNNPNDIYGIQLEEFEQTYRPADKDQTL